MVVCALEKHTLARYAVKLYINQAFFEFIKEQEVNARLINHPNVIMATKCVSKGEVNAPLFINGKSFGDYSYIVIPYHDRGTLLDLLQKASKTNAHRLSPKTAACLWKQIVKTVLHLQ